MNDETLKVYAYVITSTYRKKVVKSLSKMDMIPTQIAHDSDILPNHVSKVLREVKEKDERLDDGSTDIDSLDAFEYTIERDMKYLIQEV